MAPTDPNPWICPYCGERIDRHGAYTKGVVAKDEAGIRWFRWQPFHSPCGHEIGKAMSLGRVAEVLERFPLGLRPAFEASEKELAMLMEQIGPQDEGQEHGWIRVL